MKKSICIILLTLVMFSTASAVPSTINLNPSQKTADVGDVFTVALNVIVIGEADTVAIDLITWNANVLNCTGIAIGDLFQDVLIWLPGTIKAGSIKGSVMASNIPISNKSGTYAILSFKVTGSGDTTITVHGFGVARAGLPLDTSILGGCRITVLGALSNPPSNPVGNDSFAIPPVHPPIDDNDTVIPVTPVIPHKPVIPPIQNNSQNDTNNSKYQPISNESSANKSNGEPPLSLYFALIATVIVLLAVSIFVRKKQKQKGKVKEKDEEISDEDIFN